MFTIFLFSWPHTVKISKKVWYKVLSENFQPFFISSKARRSPKKDLLANLCSHSRLLRLSNFNNKISRLFPPKILTHFPDGAFNCYLSHKESFDCRMSEFFFCCGSLIVPTIFSFNLTTRDGNINFLKLKRF